MTAKYRKTEELQHERKIQVRKPIAKVHSSVLRGLDHVIEKVPGPVKGAEEGHGARSVVSEGPVQVGKGLKALMVAATRDVISPPLHTLRE